MDATTASSSTHHWELLGQLALCGQQYGVHQNIAALTQNVCDLLQRFLPFAWGMVAATGTDQTEVRASWGLSHEQEAEIIRRNGSYPSDERYYRLSINAEEVGYLVLPAVNYTAYNLTAQFFAALTAQIGLLFHIRLHQKHPSDQDALVPGKPVSATFPGITDLERLQMAGQRLSGDLSLDEALTALLDIVQILFPCSGVRIGLFDPYTQELRTAIQSGQFASIPTPGIELLESLVRLPYPVSLADLPTDPFPLQSDHTNNQSPPVAAYLGTALQVHNELIGTIELVSDQPDTFTQSTGHLLSVVALQATQAIVRSRRYEKTDEHLRSRVRQLRALQRISSQLTMTLYQEEILEFVLEQALKATIASHGLIVLRVVADTDTHGLQHPYHIAAVAGYTRDQRTLLLKQPINDCFKTTYAALEHEEPVLNDDVSDMERTTLYCPHAQLVLAVPIFYEGSIFGVVLLLAPDVYGFDQDAVEFVRALADQTALAIGNARRYEEQVHQVKLLRHRESLLKSVLEIGQALRSNRSLSDLLEQVGYSVIESENFRTVIFYLLDADNSDILRAVAGAGVPLTEIARLSQGAFPMTLARRYLDPQFQVGRSYFISADATSVIEAGFDTRTFLYFSYDDGSAAERPAMDIKGSPDAQTESISQSLSHQWQAGDHLFVPLSSSEDRLLGLMAVSDPIYRQRPTPRITEPLEIFADQAAIAVANSQLLDAAHAQTEQMRALYQVGAAATSTMDLDTLLDRVYQQIAAYLGTPDHFYIASYLPQFEQLCFDLFLERGAIMPRFHKSIVSKAGLPGYVIDHDYPLLVRDLVTEQNLQETDPVFVDDQRIRSWLGVPLRIQNRPLGVMCVQGFAPHLFKERDKQFLLALANQLAIAMENAGLFAEQSRQVARLALLNRVSSSAASTLDIEHIRRTLIEAMAHETGADQARLVLYDRMAGIAPIVDEYVTTSMPDMLTIPLIDNPAIDWLDEHLSPLMAYDAQHDPLLYHMCDTLRSLNIQSIALVPLIIGGEVIGFICLEFIERQVLLKPQSLELCQTIANQTVTAMENARLFAEAHSNAEALQVKVGELSTLLEAARLLSSLLKPEEVLDNLMDLARRQLNVTTAALWRIGSDNIMTLAAMDGVPMEVRRTMQVAVGEGITGQVAATGKPLAIADIQELGNSLYPDFNRQQRLVSFMGVPVISRERIVGVLSVMTSERRMFSPDEIRLLAGLADQAAMALENAGLFQDLERRVRELTTINKISATVNATFELNDLLQQLHQGISEIIDIRTSLIGLYDEETTILSYPICYDQGQRVTMDAVPLPQGSSGWAIRNRQPLLIHTAAQARAMGLDIEDRRVGNQSVEESFLVAPIMSSGRILGVINVQSYEPYAFDENDLRFVRTVANQVAVAINNAHLFTERERRIEELATFNEIGQALSATVSFEELPALIYRQTSRLLDTTNFYMALHDEAHDEISFPLFYEEGFSRRMAPVRGDNSLTRQVIRMREPLLLQEPYLNAELERLQIEPLTSGVWPRAWLGVPMIVADKVIGVIGIQDYVREHAYGPDDVRLLATIASWAAIALENARLIGETRQNVREMTALYEVSVKLSGTLDPDEMQRLVARAALDLLDTETAAVIRCDANGQIQRQVLANRHGMYQHDDLTMASRDLINQLLQMDRPLAISDLATLNPGSYPLQMGMRGVLGIALGQPEERLGVLWVGTNQPHEWPDHQKSLLSILANQAGQALKSGNLAADLEQRVIERTAELEEANDQVYDEKERLEVVHKITLALTETLDLNEIISRALEMSSTNLGVSRGSIMLREQQSGELVCRAVLQDRGVVRSASQPIVFHNGGGLSGWVLNHQEPTRIDDVRLDKRWVIEAGRADDVRSVAAVPLMTRDATLGVLILTSPKISHFTEAHMRLLATIANEVAIAINNATLYSYITEMASRLADLLEQQREETSKSRAILQSVTEGVIVLDEERRIALFNPAAENVLGIPSAEVLNQSMAILASFGHDEQQRKRAGLIYHGLGEGLEKAGEQQGIYSMSLVLPEPDQTIVVNIARVIGPDDQRYGDVAVLRDVTREIEADRTKREFISKVSHELRTPLTAIKGHVDLLLIGSLGSLNATQNECLQVARKNANRLRDLIEDILDISRIESGKIKLYFGEVSIPAIINDVVQSLGLEAKNKNMQVVLELDDTLPTVIADQRRLTQVVLNLFSNAVKYTYAQGTITVRAFLNPASMMQIEVEDNGVGMSPEQLAKLFQPFYRADNPLRDEVSGTGLGLSIAKSMIEQHGGEMWVQSEQGKGSTFSFIIPLTQSETTTTTEGYEG